MANDAERNVIITLKLVPDPKNQANASLVSSQAQSVALAGDEAYAKLRTIASESQKQISEIQKIQAGIRSDIDKQEHGERISLMEDTLFQLTKISEQLTKAEETESEKREKQRQSEHEKQVKDAKELAEKIQKAEQTRVESNQKANEAAVAAVQGMADMVEGAAKLGLVSEENFEKFSKNFNTVKETIRVVKGFSEMIWKSREALVALSTATKAQATVNELMAASQAKVAATSTVAGASSMGRTALAAGGGVAATSGTAAGGGSVVAGAFILAKLVAVVAALAAAGLALHEGFTFLLRTFGLVTDETESATNALFEMWEAQKDAKKAQEETNKREKKRQGLLDSRTRFENEEAKKAVLAGDLRNAQIEVDDAIRVAVVGRGNEEEQKRLKALREIQIAEQAILKDRKIQEKRVAAGHFKSSKNTERVLKNLEEAQGRLLEIDKNRLKVITDQKKTIADQLKTEREKHQVAKDALKSEKQRLLERVGRLDAVQQRRVDEISKKQAAGKQLTKLEIKDLEDAGLAGTIGVDFFAKKGVQAGGVGILERLGLLKKQQGEVDKAKASEEGVQRDFSRKTAAQDQLRASIVDSAERQQRIVNERVRESAELQNVRTEEIDGFQRDQENKFIRTIQQAVADGSDNITQQSMEVAKALGTNLKAMNDGLDNMKKEIEKNRFKQDVYKQ